MNTKINLEIFLFRGVLRKYILLNQRSTLLDQRCTEKFKPIEVNRLYHKILLPTDGSKYAEKAAKHAIWIAGHSNAELIALNVVDTSSLVGLPAEDLTIRVSEILKDEGQKSLDNISKLIEELEKNEEFKTGVKLIKESKEGPPADVILKTVKEENIDLIVMGTSGKHGLDRFLLGSVTEKVVRSSKVPVLAVH